MQVGETEWEVFAQNVQLGTRTAVTLLPSSAESRLQSRIWTLIFSVHFLATAGGGGGGVWLQSRNWSSFSTVHFLTTPGSYWSQKLDCRNWASDSWLQSSLRLLATRSTINILKIRKGKVWRGRGFNRQSTQIGSAANSEFGGRGRGGGVNRQSTQIGSAANSELGGEGRGGGSIDSQLR